MSTTRNENNVEEEKPVSGCDTMDLLWKSAQACYLTKPGIAGTLERVKSFVTCSNIYPFMRIAALKCWQERTKLGANPSALFTPLDLSEDTEKSKTDEASKDQRQQTSNEQSQKKQR